MTVNINELVKELGFCVVPTKEKPFRLDEVRFNPVSYTHLDFGTRDSEFYHDHDPTYGNHCYRIDDLLLVHDSRLEKEQDRKW